MILYAMESAWHSPSRTRGTKRMSVMPALVQTDDGGYAELDSGGDQDSEGGGAQTVQGHGDVKQTHSDSDGARGMKGRGSDDDNEETNVGGHGQRKSDSNSATRAPRQPDEQRPRRGRLRAR
ncbi:MAG: hypothetical protein ACR2K0_04675 [Acidimicrobiales bacterium]